MLEIKNLNKSFKQNHVLKDVSFKINKDNISTAMPIVAIVQNRLCHGNLSIIRCPSTGANTGMMQVMPLSSDSTFARRRSSSVSRKMANATT